MGGDAWTDTTAAPADDDELVVLVGHALTRVDPVPAHLVDGARSAFTWRTIDVELAELTFDSAHMATGVRAVESDRQVTFASPGIEIELTVIGSGARRLVGQLVPPSPATVELTACANVVTTCADDLGRFSFDDVAAGPLRLAVREAGRTVQTEILF